MDDDIPNLGPCCVCEGRVGVTNIVMLDRRGPTLGKGWGCFVCDLPAEGAVAVLCDQCLGQAPRFVCTGYPIEDGRTPIGELSAAPFEHKHELHQEGD